MIDAVTLLYLYCKEGSILYMSTFYYISICYEEAQLQGLASVAMKCQPGGMRSVYPQKVEVLVRKPQLVVSFRELLWRI